jgi:hypothetical protein
LSLHVHECGSETTNVLLLTINDRHFVVDILHGIIHGSHLGIDAGDAFINTGDGIRNLQELRRGDSSRLLRQPV